MSRVPGGPSTDKDKDGVCFQHPTSLSSVARAHLGGGAATAWDNMAQRGEAAGKTRGHGLRMWLQMPGRAPQ